jgi:hypothetical protein
MLANAVFVATLIFLALGFWLMHELHFLVPWRSLILHNYLHSIVLYCALLFANILGLTISGSSASSSCATRAANSNILTRRYTVGAQNSQKKSPRSSAKSRHDTTGAPGPSQKPRKLFEDFDEEERYMDRSGDHVACVRAAKDAAQREMESFGDVSEYDITIIQGQLKEAPATGSQSALDFQDDAPTEPKESK